MRSGECFYRAIYLGVKSTGLLGETGNLALEADPFKLKKNYA